MPARQKRSTRRDDRVRILVVARSAARRESLSTLVAKGFGREAIEIAASSGLSPSGKFGAAENGGPDVVVADIDGSSPAASLMRFIEEEASGSGAVALVDDPDPRWVRAALHAGVNAIVLREPGVDELRLAVSAADAGLTLLHPTLTRSLLPAALEPSEPAHDAEALTPREYEVLSLLGDGLGNKEIASRLAISEHTAKFHISSILGKLGAASRTEAVSTGIRRGLIAI